MRFLVDAHLPIGLCLLLQSNGHEAIHTSELTAKNRTTDQTINDMSMRRKLIVVSKDTDFYYSHLLRQRPHKLLLVRTGNIGVGELKKLFANQMAVIIDALEKNSLVELHRTHINVVV